MSDDRRNVGPGADNAPPTTQLPPSATNPSSRAYSQMGSTASFGSPSEAFGTAGSGALPPAGPPSGPVVHDAPAKRNRGKIIALISVAVVLLLVIAFAGFELYSRNKVKDCIATGVSSLTGTPVDVSLSAKPILLQGLSGEIPYVQVDTQDTAADATKLHLRLDDITADGDTSKVGSIAGTGFLSYNRILELMTTGQNGTSGTTITKIAGNSATGAVTIDATMVVAILPIPVSVTVKPSVVDGKVTLDVLNATAAVFGIPADFAQGIVDQLTQAVFDTAFGGVKLTNVKVTDTGVDFTIDAQNVVLKQQVSSPQGSCSTLF